MSAFAVTSGLYLRAAVIAYEQSSQLGFSAVMYAAGQRDLRDEAWSLFRRLFLIRRIQFESREHCVMALLLMAEICEDEENEEEGQL